MHIKDRAKLQQRLVSNNVDDVTTALLEITYHVGDQQWIEKTLLTAIGHENQQVRGLAITCLGHCARIFGGLQTPSILSTLITIRDDEKDPCSGRADDALDDIALFSTR